jgi:hypothetical protein
MWAEGHGIIKGNSEDDSACTEMNIWPSVMKTFLKDIYCSF